MRSLIQENTLAWWRPSLGAFTNVLRNSAGWLGLKHQENILWMVLISLITMASLLALYNLRALDDNGLSSWWWVFDGVMPFTFLLMLVVAITLAYGISRLPFHGRAAVPLLFVASFLIVASLWQQPEVIVDAARYFIQAKYLELNGIGYFLAEWGNAVPAWTDLPLAPLIYGAIFQVFGENRVAIQIFTSLLFSGTVVLTCLIGNTLWSRELGLTAGLMLLGMPYLLAQVPLMMVDVAAMFFLTLAVFATIMAITHGGMLYFILAAVAITLAMLTKYSNWLMLSVVPVIMLSHTHLGWKLVFSRTAAVAVGVLVLMGVFLFAKFDVVAAQFNLLISFQAPALGRWGESLLSIFFFQIHPFVSIAAIISTYLAVKRKDARYAIISWMLLIVMLFELRRIRYFLVLLPMLALMAAYGLETIKHAGYRKFIAASTAVTAILITIVGYLPFFQGMSVNNIKQAGEYLDSIRAGTTEIHVLPQTRSLVNPVVAVPLLDLFTDQQLVYHPDVSTVPAVKMISKLPWRWTWELDSTAYLERTNSAYAAQTVVVIQSETDQTVPDYLIKRIDGYHLQKEFVDSSQVFRFRTIVRIYQRA